VHLVGFYYKNISWCTVLWISNPDHSIMTLPYVTSTCRFSVVSCSFRCFIWLWTQVCFEICFHYLPGLYSKSCGRKVQAGLNLYRLYILENCCTNQISQIEHNIPIKIGVSRNSFLSHFNITKIISFHEPAKQLVLALLGLTLSSPLTDPHK
jgi:hypothetical protein